MDLHSPSALLVAVRSVSGPRGAIHEPPFVFRRKLRTVDGQRQLVQLAGEAEGYLVIIRDRRAGVGANVEVLVPLHDERNGMRDALARHLLAIDLEHTSAAAANAAHIVVGERADTE